MTKALSNVAAGFAYLTFVLSVEHLLKMGRQPGNMLPAIAQAFLIQTVQSGQQQRIDLLIAGVHFERFEGGRRWAISSGASTPGLFSMTSLLFAVDGQAHLSLEHTVVVIGEAHSRVTSPALRGGTAISS